jgi:hypothetical protein
MPPPAPTARATRAALAAAVLLLAAAPLAAQQRDDQDWCRDGWSDDDRATHCEVREVALDARRQLRVDGRANGGVRVRAWDRGTILVRARVQATAGSRADAEAIAGAVRIADGDVVRAEGPSDLGRREHWSVSYEVMVPRDTDLELEASNGGLDVAGVRGTLALRTVNGGIRLSDVHGDVRGRTSNGGVHVELTGRRWEGRGLDVETSNGGVRLDIPDGYAASLEAGTTNGGLQLDFPITVQGRLDRRLRAELGGGGAPIRVVTTNGGVTIRRR